MSVEPTDLSALRLCALICWQKRELLTLRPEQVDQVLVAWIAAGNAEEAEAASRLLAARRAKAEKQQKFDCLLEQTSKPQA